MTTVLAERLRLSQQVEDGMFRLYQLMSALYPEDAAFWQELAAEEDRHHSMLNSLEETMSSWVDLPAPMLAQDVRALRETVGAIQAWHDALRDGPCDQLEACHRVVQLEQTSAELCYQQYMTGRARDEAARILRELNGDDRNHALRIVAHMDALRARATAGREDRP